MAFAPEEQQQEGKNHTTIMSQAMYHEKEISKRINILMGHKEYIGL